MDEKIIEALNDCLERLDRGEALEAVLSRYPEARRELEPLLRASIVTRRALAGVVPPPGARARVWTHLQPDMKGRSRPRRFSLFWLRPWAVAVTSLFLVFLLAGGTVLASANSLPHQPLYAVKLAAEQAQLSLTPTKAGKARLELSFAEKRAREMVAVAQLNRPEELQKLADRLEAHLEKVAGRAVEAPASPPLSPVPQEAAEKTTEGTQALTATPPSPQPGDVAVPQVAATPQPAPTPEATATAQATPAPEATATPQLAPAPPAAAAVQPAPTPEATPTPEAARAPEEVPGPPPQAEGQGEGAKPEKAEPETTPTPEATTAPAFAATPQATPTPERTATPQATPTPERTATPRATPTPEPTATPRATPTPERTATPRATPTPERTATPRATPTPERTATPQAAAGPSVTPTSKAAPAKPEKTDLEARLEDGARLQDQLLQENLDKVPPESRDALRQALEKNRDNYQQALKRLQEKQDQGNKD